MLNLGESKIYSPYAVYLDRITNDRFKYKKFHDGLKVLPEKLQDFIFDITPADFIKDKISTPFDLNENQSKETAIIVMDLVLSDLYLGNIVQEIQNRLNVDEIKAKTIAGLIVTELFAPILEELKKMHIEKFAKNIPKPQIQNNPPPPADEPNGDDHTINLKNNL